MGFENQRVLSDEAFVSQYECIICQSLVDLDCLVTTACSHVFCRSCLVPWLERTQKENLPAGVLMAETVPKCPTCNQNLLFSSSSSNTSSSQTMMVGSRALLVQPLERCQPLAHRVLKRIKVRCPLHEASLCSWSGDYGDLQDHLLSPSAHVQRARSPQFTDHTSRSSSDEAENENEAMDVEYSHTESSSVSASLERAIAVATSFKEQGNEKFATKHYQQACDLYTKAISILKEQNNTPAASDSPNLQQLSAALYCNRAACYHGLNSFSSAAEDASAAIAIDPQYTKAYLRKAKSLVQMADFSTALSALAAGLTSCDNSPQLKKELTRVNKLNLAYEKSLSLLDEGQFASAKAELGNLLRETAASIILLQTARADLGMGLVDSANRFCIQALRNRQSQLGSAEPLAYLVQGQCKVLSVGETEDTKILESGVSLLRHVLKLDPDSKLALSVIKPWLKVSSKLKQARQDAFSREFDSALELYSTCIKTCPLLPPKAPLYSALHTERAQVLRRLKRYDEALQDVALVVYNREDHVAAWMVRFACLHAKGRHETVLEEVQDLLRKFGDNDSRIRQAYEKADFEVRKAKRIDYYKLLKVSSIASEREIKKAYRQVAKDMHPDRFASASEAERMKAQQNFQALSEGLEILTDDFQRKLYDEGYDVEAIKERVQAAEQAAHRSNYHRHGHGGYHGGH